MTTFIRGSVLTFTATCTDADGAPVTPDSATLYLRYTTAAGVAASTSIAMVVAGNIVTASWDSSLAADRPIRWHIRTTGADKIAVDGTTELSANEANPNA